MTDLEGWVLSGDSADPAVAWIENGTLRRDVFWPQGYRAAFDPTLRVVDRLGRSVVEAGDGLVGGCRIDERYRLVEGISFK